MSRSIANREFYSHTLTTQGAGRAEAIATSFDILLTTLTLSLEVPMPDGTKKTLPSLVPPGRELDIVKSKLEEACFYAKKAMASLPEYQITPGEAKQEAPSPVETKPEVKPELKPEVNPPEVPKPEPAEEPKPEAKPAKDPKPKGGP